MFLYSRCAFDVVDEIIFTPNVQSDHHFGLFLLFGYDFIDYSGFSRAFPLPHLRPRVDVAGAEGVREYLKQRFVPGVGVCFLLVFVVEISAFGVALANGVLRVDGKLLCDVAVYCQAYNVARGGYVEFFFSHCCHPFFS